MMKVFVRSQGSNSNRLRVALAALLLDLLLGDPPNRFHPVAWMGSAIAAARRQAPTQGRVLPLIYGGLISPGGALLVGMFGRLCAAACRLLPAPLNWLAEAALLKLTFSLRGLDSAAAAVERELVLRDLPAARRVLSWHLVSRDTSALDTPRVAAAAIESVAENASDGVVAPLFYYALGGLPLAVVYRWVNTADSMLGYRDPAREWLGKLPARFDDLVNLVPSRLTALLLVIAAFLSGADGRGAWHYWRRDGHRTASPNAGQPMSAMAGALGVELEKVDHYRLGAGLRLPATEDIRRARRLVIGAIIVGLFMWFIRGCHGSPPPPSTRRAERLSRGIRLR
jgi:adenosylcobinamide-phosphate synthase